MMQGELYAFVEYMFKNAAVVDVQVEDEVKALRLRRQMYTDLMRHEETGRILEQDIVSVTKQELMLDRVLSKNWRYSHLSSPLEPNVPRFCLCSKYLTHGHCLVSKDNTASIYIDDECLYQLLGTDFYAVGQTLLDLLKNINTVIGPMAQKHITLSSDEQAALKIKRLGRVSCWETAPYIKELDCKLAIAQRKMSPKLIERIEHARTLALFECINWINREMDLLSKSGELYVRALVFQKLNDKSPYAAGYVNASRKLAFSQALNDKETKVLSIFKGGDVSKNIETRGKYWEDALLFYTQEKVAELEAIRLGLLNVVISPKPSEPKAVTPPKIIKKTSSLNANIQTTGGSYSARDLKTYHKPVVSEDDALIASIPEEKLIGDFKRKNLEQGGLAKKPKPELVQDDDEDVVEGDL